MSDLCIELEGNVPGIVDEWWRLTDKAPWNALADADRLDHLPELLAALLKAALCDPASHAAREEVVAWAASHGEQRRSLAFDEATLFVEQSVLRTAIWHFMIAYALQVDEEPVVAEILRIDAGMSIVTLASLMGLHRDQVGQSREWSGVLSELVSKWERTFLTAR